MTNSIFKIPLKTQKLNLFFILLPNPTRNRRPGLGIVAGCGAPRRRRGDRGTRAWPFGRGSSGAAGVRRRFRGQLTGPGGSSESPKRSIRMLRIRGSTSLSKRSSDSGAIRASAFRVASISRSPSHSLSSGSSSRVLHVTSSMSSLRASSGE